MTVYDEIKAERARQDERWGGPEHDDKEHSSDLAWTHLLYSYLTHARTAAVYGHPLGGKTYRERMVQVAALAVAAIESHDRKRTPS